MVLLTYLTEFARAHW